MRRDTRSRKGRGAETGRGLLEGRLRKSAAGRILVAAALLLIASTSPLPASDHGDTALLRSIQRHDARITDLYALIRDEKLVLAVCLDPTIPVAADDYRFPVDLSVSVYLDTHSAVDFSDPDAKATLGGVVREPGKIAADIELRVGFDRQNRPVLKTAGMPGRMLKDVELFAGLRDDPFIRGPRIGRNVAAIVLQLPVAEVIEPHGVMLVWAVTKVPDIRGPQADLAGRGLRNQFPENEAMNLLPPRDHFDILGLAPDVLIFDTSRHAAFPNGRELADDVVDLVGDPRPLADDQPYPSENDVPFLDVFPYLPPPHRP